MSQPGQRAELAERRHVGVESRLAAGGLRHQFGQVVIGLRPHDDIDPGAADDLFALGLGDAAGDRDHRLRAPVGTRALPQAADVRIDLLGRLLADVAGVEHDEIGGLALGGGGHALRGHQLGHALAVIDVHLAAERLDLEGPGILGILGGVHRGACTPAVTPAKAGASGGSCPAIA